MRKGLAGIANAQWPPVPRRTPAQAEALREEVRRFNEAKDAPVKSALEKEIKDFIAKGFPENDFKSAKEYYLKAKDLRNKQIQWKIVNPDFEKYVSQTVVPKFDHMKDALKVELETIPEEMKGNDDFSRQWLKKYKENEDILKDDPRFSEIKSAASQVEEYVRPLEENERQRDKRDSEIRSEIAQRKKSIEGYNKQIESASKDIEKMRGGKDLEELHSRVLDATEKERAKTYNFDHNNKQKYDRYKEILAVEMPELSDSEKEEINKASLIKNIYDINKRLNEIPYDSKTFNDTYRTLDNIYRDLYKNPLINETLKSVGARPYLSHDSLKPLEGLSRSASETLNRYDPYVNKSAYQKFISDQDKYIYDFEEKKQLRLKSPESFMTGLSYAEKEILKNERLIPELRAKIAEEQATLDRFPANYFQTTPLQQTSTPAAAAPSARPPVEQDIPRAPGPPSAAGSRRPSLETIFSEGVEDIGPEDASSSMPRREAPPRSSAVPPVEPEERRGSMMSTVTVGRQPVEEQSPQASGYVPGGVLSHNRNSAFPYQVFSQENPNFISAPWETEQSPIRNQRQLNYDRIIPQFGNDSEQQEDEEEGPIGYARGGPVWYNSDRGMNEMNPILAYAAMDQRRQGMQQPSMGYSSQPLPQQAPEQPMPQPQEESPIKRGASTAYEAARNSLKMNNEDRSRSLGAALMHFGAGLGKPGYGFGGNGTLSAIAQSMPQATEAYRNEEDAIMAEKMKHYQLQMMERAYQDKQRQQEQDRQLEMAKLAETARYHDLMGARHTKENQKEIEYERAQAKQQALQEKFPGAVPYEAMSLTERAAAVKKHRELERNLPEYSKILKDLNELKAINKAHPGLASTTVRAMYKEGPGFMAEFGRKFASKEDRVAAEKSKKIIGDLLGHKIKSMSGNRVTDIMKKTLGESLPNLYQAPETVDFLIDEMLSEYGESYKNAQLAPLMISGQFDLPYGIAPRNMKPEEEATQEMGSMETSEGQPMNQDVQSRLQQIQQKRALLMQEKMRRGG